MNDVEKKAGEIIRVGETTELAEPKKAALELLMWGKSVSETARQTGVTRITIHRWLKNDPVFRAAYNEWHEEMRESSRSRLETMAEKAMDALDNALHSNDARAAIAVLKGLGLLRERKPGPTDAEEVKKEAEIRKKKREAELFLEEMGLPEVG